MGKTTTRPISILVIGLEETPELKALAAEGHTIMYSNGNMKFQGVDGVFTVDVVTGPRMWRLLPDQMKWLPLLLKEARAAQPPRVKKAKVTRGATSV